MNWINSKLKKPEPLKADGLTFVLISWMADKDFRDYMVIYYAPCDEHWYPVTHDDYEIDLDDGFIIDFDYWCYITDPTKKQ